MHNWRHKLGGLALAVCLLTGCSRMAGSQTTARQLQLYYCCAQDVCDEQTGALAAEAVSMQQLQPQRVLERYQNGPEDASLRLPLADVQSYTVQSETDGVLQIAVRTAEAPSAIEKSLLAACLTLTMTQLETVDAVELVWQTESAEELAGPFTPDSFLLYDASAESPEYAVALYYPDKDGLLAKKTKILSCTDSEQLPLLALQALIAEPLPVNLTRPVPVGTQVLDLSVSGGTASVVLSSEFMSCDVSAQLAQNAVRALAATLCALSGIDTVRLSVIGETGLTYYNISQPIVPEESWYAAQS